MEKKVSSNKMHRIWAFIVSLVITAAAVVAIVVLAIVSKNSDSTNEETAKSGIIDDQSNGSDLGTNNTVENPDSVASSNSTNSNNSSNSSTSSSSNSSSSSSSISQNSTAETSEAIPQTGPEDILGLALLSGSIIMYISSLVMAKRNHLPAYR